MVVGLLYLWRNTGGAVNMVKKTKGAFGKPKWQRSKKVKIEPIPEIIEIPSEKKSWWGKLKHKIWGRS